MLPPVAARNGAEEIADADHAGDDVGLPVGPKPSSDELVDCGELSIELDHVGGESGDSGALGRRGLHRCGGLVRIADLAMAKPSLQLAGSDIGDGPRVWN